MEIGFTSWIDAVWKEEKNGPRVNTENILNYDGLSY